jgi:murein DD-endopeptidase MepM/ murein hydrolase activator NlpD
MRRLGPLLLVLLAFPAPAMAASGGSKAPTKIGTPATKTGGALPTPRLRATRFLVSTTSVQAGERVRFTWRIDGPVRTARASVLLTGGGKTLRIPFGRRRTGTLATRTWTATVAAGRYTAQLEANGPSGAALRRTARASGRLALQVTPPPAAAPAPAVSGIFPVQGAYTMGDGFGAARSGHSHQGQDLLAAAGTPVVTPVAGVIHWRAYQKGGAGNYVIVRGDDGRDYAFMHFLDGSTVVEKGQRVAAGQRLASVGSTGYSTGPHLHFEIWPDGWYASKDSRPIDPLPDLLAWASAA